MSYPAIAEHGLIGDLQTAALVTTDGTVDWFCCPRFDSPSVFAALLDDEKGGRFSITAVGDGTVTKQMYQPDTAILITRYLSEGGVAEVVDFMPIDDPERASDHHRLVRGIRGVRGEVTFDVRVEPRFDYARQSHRIQGRRDHGPLRERRPRRSIWCQPGRSEADGNDVRVALHRSSRRAGGVPARVGSGGRADDHGSRRAADALRRHRELLAALGRTRSLPGALAGGGVPLGDHAQADDLRPDRRPRGGTHRRAARTGRRRAELGLPLHVGARCVVLRVRTAGAWVSSTRPRRSASGCGTRVEETPRDSARPLHIMYRIDGSPDLVEETLDHLDGYRASRPVRIGNGAADQLQLDIYGEFMDTIYLAGRVGIGIADAGWRTLVGVLDWVCDNWEQPDEGIWETRGGQRPFVYGRLMCWVALDRGIRIAIDRGLPADLARWTEERNRHLRGRHGARAGTKPSAPSPSTKAAMSSTPPSC